MNVWCLLMFFAFTLSTCNGDDNDEQRKRKLLAHGFGPYHINIRSIGVCPKSGTWKPDEKATPVNVTLSTSRLNRTSQLVTVDYTYPSDVCLTAAYIEIEAQRSGALFDIEYRKKTDTACGHPLFGPVLKSIFKVDDKCCFKKGRYTASVNPTECLHRWLRDIQYNTYNFVLEWYSHKGIVSCLKVLAEVKPITTQTIRARPKKKKN